MSNRTPPASTENESTLTRRRFLAWMIGGVSAFITAVIGLPLAGLLVSPIFAKTNENWVDLGATDGFPENSPQSVEFSSVQTDGWIQETVKRSVWVVNLGSGNFNVYNPRCVHLGCAYNWVPDKQEFVCPCHAGVYTLEGKVVAGPPPRPLDTLPIKIDGGKLYTMYQDYRLGVPDKLPV